MKKKQDSGIIYKKVKKYYKDIDLVEIVNSIKFLGLLSKTECYEINSSLEHPEDPNRKFYQSYLRKFLLRKISLKEAM